MNTNCAPSVKSRNSNTFDSDTVSRTLYWVFLTVFTLSWISREGFLSNNMSSKSTTKYMQKGYSMLSIVLRIPRQYKP